VIQATHLEFVVQVKVTAHYGSDVFKGCFGRQAVAMEAVRIRGWSIDSVQCGEAETIMAPDTLPREARHLPLRADGKSKGQGLLAQEIGDCKLPVKIVFLTMYKDEDIFNEALDVGVTLGGVSMPLMERGRVTRAQP
jgi:hypothetical protein